MLGGELREDLAVELDVALLESSDERRVGLVAVLADSCVQADYPERAVVTLLVLAVIEGVLASVDKRLLCEALLGSAAMAVALRTLKYVAAALCADYSSFYSCHKLIDY